MGGKISKIDQWVSIAPFFQVNERAIYFLKNKEPNTYIIDEKSLREIPIFGTRNGGHGTVFVESWSIDAQHYVKLLKQSVADTTAYYRFIHEMKMSEEQQRLARLKYKDGLMLRDSVMKAHRLMWKIEHDSAKKGGVK